MRNQSSLHKVGLGLILFCTQGGEGSCVSKTEKRSWMCVSELELKPETRYHCVEFFYGQTVSYLMSK